MRSLLLALLFLAAPALAQTPCQGGSASAPACSRNWATAPLTVRACPATASTNAGARVLLTEVDGTPLLSVTPGVPGGDVAIPTASAPVVRGTSATRVIRFTCEDAGGVGGDATFASVTFPVDRRPVAPVLP